MVTWWLHGGGVVVTHLEQGLLAHVGDAAAPAPAAASSSKRRPRREHKPSSSRSRAATGEPRSPTRRRSHTV